VKTLSSLIIEDGRQLLVIRRRLMGDVVVNDKRSVALAKPIHGGLSAASGRPQNNDVALD
jgi:hypothetical protein